MAGIYIHIPFCKQACHYCNFHFSTNLRLKSQMLIAIEQELYLQKNYLDGLKIHSIYLGGGTPSLLEAEEINLLLIHIKQNFLCEDMLEITLEANPDDVNLNKLLLLKDIGVNRLSIGIQSFQDNLLRYLNRSHSAAKSINSLEIALKAGFNNFNLDLIYAIPGQSDKMWQEDLEIAIKFLPTHISAYCLTIESNTVFGRWAANRQLKIVEDEIAIKHFDLLISKLNSKHYDHYEISNFSLPGYNAVHNTNYWKRGSYLGLGPGAHSYNGTSRQHNITNNPIYIQNIQNGIIPATIEQLQWKNHINEYIMTSLRTKWGCDMRLLKEHYAYDLMVENTIYIERLVARKLACINEKIIQLTIAGKMLADKIASDLFIG